MRRPIPLIREDEAALTGQLRRAHDGHRKPRVQRSHTKRSTAWCACASKPSSKWLGPITPRSPKAIPAFQDTCHAQLRRVVPPATIRPTRVLSQDESRPGVSTTRRQPLTARGAQPIRRAQHVFEWCCVSGAVEPTTGDRFRLELPYIHADTCQRFLETCAQACPDGFDILLLGNSGAHTTLPLTRPEHIRFLRPPDCPALHPIERLWRDLKDVLPWPQCPDRDARQEYLANLLQGCGRDYSIPHRLSLPRGSHRCTTYVAKS
jgi:hypothetical protein